MLNDRYTSDEEENENKEQFLPDLRTAVIFNESELSSNIGTVVSPLLTFDDKISSMQVSHSFYHFFHGTFLIEKLLHHIAYGEFKNAEIMIKRDPKLLLQKGSVKIAHTGQEFKDKTPLQIALYLKDPEMVELFQSHIEDLKEVERQQRAQFPEGYEDEKNAKIIDEGYSILESIFQDIDEAKVDADENHNLILDKKAQLAIKRLEDYLKHRCTAESKTGQDIGDALLIKAYELFDENFDRFGGSHDDPKNMLAWRRVVGNVQRYSLTFHHVQTMSQGGVMGTMKEIEKGERQQRTSTFSTSESHNTDFLTMVSGPATAQLGNNSAIHGSGLWVAGGAGGSGVGSFKALCQLKNDKVIKLIKDPARPKSSKRKPSGYCLMM